MAKTLIVEIHEPKPKDNLKSLVKEMFEAIEQGQTIKNNSVYHQQRIKKMQSISAI
jgi:hypothetical protein